MNFIYFFKKSISKVYFCDDVYESLFTNVLSRCFKAEVTSVIIKQTYKRPP